VTSGISYLYVKENYPDASVLKLGFVHPFCDDKMASFVKSVERAFVVEELDSFLETHLKTLGLSVGAKDPSYRIGELRPESIPPMVAGEARNLERPPVRKPVFCPGCPHRFVFQALKGLKTVVAGDIGCYTLAATPPMATMHTTICMGAGITVHEGLKRALGKGRIVGVVGDSTFVHSGITGLINAVYNRVTGLLIILDNGTTAMTGGQNHPATGRNIRDEEAPKLELEKLCRACGADTVDVIDPNRYEELEGLIEKRLSEDNLSVIIARSPCKLLDRDSQPAPAYEKSLCRTCGLCLKIDCPGVKELPGGYIEIDQAVCTGCDLCVEVCPFDGLVSRQAKIAGGEKTDGI
jgi:indolepyruvate ferredoxin oxidoreductase alpha subunit